MKPVPFNPQNDLATIPFEKNLCHLALEMKQLGLPWSPHVGCFVWDLDEHIETNSPFPERIYFILSMPRFLSIFGSVENMIRKLVWLPTWHQARLLCQRMHIESANIAKIWKTDLDMYVGGELAKIYMLLIQSLSNNRS